MLLQPNHNKFGLYKEKAGLKLLPPQEGLICNLDMENVVGSTIYDRTGNGRNFTSYNSPSVTSGVKGLNKGLSYGGTNQYSTSGSFSLFDYNTFTVEWWTYIDGVNDQVVHCGDASSQTGFGNNNFFALYYNVSDTTVRFRSARIGNLTGITHTVNIGYCHMIFQIKNRNRFSAYVNGVFIDEIDCLFPAENNSGIRNIDINRVLRTGNTTVYYKSKAFSLRVWDRALSEKEIQYLYNNGYGIK